MRRFSRVTSWYFSHPDHRTEEGGFSRRHHFAGTKLLQPQEAVFDQIRGSMHEYVEALAVLPGAAEVRRVQRRQPRRERRDLVLLALQCPQLRECYFRHSRRDRRDLNPIGELGFTSAGIAALALAQTSRSCIWMATGKGRGYPGAGAAMQDLKTLSLSDCQKRSDGRGHPDAGAAMQASEDVES